MKTLKKVFGKRKSSAKGEGTTQPPPAPITSLPEQPELASHGSVPDQTSSSLTPLPFSDDLVRHQTQVPVSPAVDTKPVDPNEFDCPTSQSAESGDTSHNLTVSPTGSIPIGGSTDIL